MTPLILLEAGLGLMLLGRVGVVKTLSNGKSDTIQDKSP